MKVYLAGLDAGHFRSADNGYTRAAHDHLLVLASFFFYVDPKSHGGRTTSLIPQKASDENLPSARR